MKLKALLATTSLLMSGHAYSSTCTNATDTMYGISGGKDVAASLFTIDTETAATSPVSAPEVQGAEFSLTHDIVHNRLYYVSRGTKVLAYYDIATDSHHTISTNLMHQATDRLTINEAGILVASHGRFLYGIETDGGEYIDLGWKLKGLHKKRERKKGDIAYGPDGTLYLITKTSLFTLDTVNMQATKVSNHSLRGASGMAFDSQGNMYVSNVRKTEGDVKVSDIHLMDPTDASTTLVGTTDATIDDLAIHTHCPGGRPDITVMGYNVMQLPFQDWNQDERATRLAGAILADSSNPDVISFSEVLTDDAYAGIQDLAPTYSHFTPVLGQVCSGGGWDSISGDCSNSIAVVRGGVAIASKHPILEQHAYVFNASQFGTADYLANKGAVYAKIENNGFNYHVIAIHTQATHNGSEEAHAIRLQQVEEVRLWIDNNFDIPAHEPVILAGDLNVAHDNTSELEDIIEYGLDATLWFDNANTPGYVHSYPEDNWMARAYNYYFKEDPCYNKTLDYVVNFNGYLQPSEPAQMDVIELKTDTPFYWSYLDGYWYEHSSWRQGICASGAGFTDYYGNTGVTQGYYNGYHRDLSDHYPVVATYKYN